jgi:hypothetical protein
MRYRLSLLTVLVLLLVSGCGGTSSVDKNLFATCIDGFKEYETNCQDVCKAHGGVRQFGLKGGDCAKNPPP